jgi:hypothetical protein
MKPEALISTRDSGYYRFAAVPSATHEIQELFVFNLALSRFSVVGFSFCNNATKCDRCTGPRSPNRSAPRPT